ncbi:TetR family transcriptional regulator [Microbacterium sp. Leaf159]|uniref:TetR family transcriptional regulator n=1 Tax=Microbacterium sp. Leaf159 TaxID=1736279 RepID=UPI0009EB7C69|nr:TetR family transcriptional regulator [Microbacterium sp. Leaf159]
MATDVRTRGRELLRGELADAAAKFCAERGFDMVTVEEIARAIGISRATFFRYFASKEDAVVTSARIGRLSLAEQLRRVTPSPGTPVSRAVLEAMTATVVAARTEPEVLRARVAMIGASPSLRATLASERSTQRADLEVALRELVAGDAQARAAAYAAMAAIEMAWETWRSEDVDFGDALEQAFELIAEVNRTLIS